MTERASGERSGGAIKFEVRTAHIERTGSVGLAAVAGGSCCTAGCNCDDQRGGVYHRIRTDYCTIRPNGRRSKACSGLRPWIKMNSRGVACMAAPAGNDDGRRTTIVEMRQQHRRGDWPGPVRGPKILRGRCCWLCCSEASIEPLQSVIDYGNRSSCGRLRCTPHSS